MRIAIAGRPGAGKSALFDLLAHRAAPGGAEASNRGGLRTAHVEVPDPRVEELSRAYRPRKTTPARLVFQDLEQKAAPAYPALSPQRRELLAQADLILLVIDLYNCGPSEWGSQAAEEWRAALDEYALTDLAVVETRRHRLQKALKIGQDPHFPGEPEVLDRLYNHLETGRTVREFPFTADEARGLHGYAFLSARPVLPAFNLAESDLAGAGDALGRIAGEMVPGNAAAGESNAGASPWWVFFCAEVERQIQDLPLQDQTAFLEAFHLAEPAVAQVIRAAYRVSGLQSFFTVGDDEVRAWTIRRGATAPEAAGVIHSDLEKSFVRAEILAYSDWLRYGSHNAAREKGAVRLEGREYAVQDGEILNIRSGLARGGR